MRERWRMTLRILKSKIFVAIALIICLVILGSRRYYYDKEIKESIVKAKVMEEKNQDNYPYLYKEKKVRWMYDALNYGNINQSSEKVSEAEFIFLMYSIYKIAPENVVLSNHWADDYYESAKNYGYPVLSGSDRDKPLSRTHAAELVAATQGESLQGDNAIRFLLDNHFVSNKYSNVNDFKKDEALTRVDALELSKSVFSNGFYQFQRIINNTNKKQNLVVLGDSISLGWGIIDLASPSNYGYPNVISDKKDLNVMNLASSGLVSGVLASKIKIPLYINKLTKANFIIVNIGGADLQSAAREFLTSVRDNNGADPTNNQTIKIKDAENKFNKNIEKIITEIRSYSKAPILLYYVYNPIPEGMLGNVFVNKILEEVNNQTKDIAIANKDVFYLDSYSAFKGKEDTLLIENDTHPNKEGQKVLAKLALEKLNEINTTRN